MTRGYYGLLDKTPDDRDYVARPGSTYTGEFVDLSSEFPQPPYDQLQLGACVPNGTAAAVDFARVKQGLAPLGPPSRLQIYYDARKLAGYPLDQDTGLQIRDGFKTIAKVGAAPESDWPYNISAFADAPPAKAEADAGQDEAVAYGAVKSSDIDNVIASGYPVVFGFDVHESFESDEVAETGIMPLPARGEQDLGGHCVVAVSTRKSGKEIPGADPALYYRKCRNSWNTDWGQGGYFWMPTSIMEAKGDDCWQVTAMASPDAPTPPGPTPTPQPAPSPSVFTTALEALRSAWSDLDAFLRSHGL